MGVPTGADDQVVFLHIYDGMNYIMMKPYEEHIIVDS